MLEKRKSHDKSNNRYKVKYSEKMLTNNISMKNQNFNENKQQNDFTTAEAAWMEKKQKLYKDTNNQPLWDFRKIEINPTDTEELISFPTNKISSCRYSTYSFIFKSLYEQFLRLPNIWFLLISLLEFIPAFHNISNYLYYSKHKSIYLLFFFIFVSIMKNIYEDSRRSNIDSQMNNRLCHVVDVSNSQLKAVKWMDLTVGSIIRLIENEQVPADILLLSCNNNEGLVYVETSLINGETNLNKKCCVNETRNETSMHGICNIKGRIICEKPNSNMESFNGSLKLDAYPRATSLSINNVVFKGSYIKNTDHIFGVIIYTGTDTKIMKNMLRNTYKFGYVNKELNMYTIITIFFTLICVFISVLCKWTEDDKFKSGTHFMLITTKDNLFESIIKYILLYSNTIPISILITVDLISIFQSIIIENDNRISTFENESSDPSAIDENEQVIDLKMNKSCKDFRNYAFFMNHFSKRNFSKKRYSYTNNESNSVNRKSFISTFHKLSKIKNYFYNTNSLMNNSKSQSNTVNNRSSMALSDTIHKKYYGWGICLNSNMHGDLGNVDFIFTDKTGTLTNNEMFFNIANNNNNNNDNNNNGNSYSKKKKSKSSSYDKKSSWCKNRADSKKTVDDNEAKKNCFATNTGNNLHLGNSNIHEEIQEKEIVTEEYDVSANVQTHRDCDRNINNNNSNRYNNKLNNSCSSGYDSDSVQHMEKDEDSSDYIMENIYDKMNSDNYIKENMDYEDDKNNLNYKSNSSRNYKGKNSGNINGSRFYNRYKSSENSSTSYSSSSSTCSSLSDNFSSSYIYSSSNYDSIEMHNDNESVRSCSNYTERQNLYAPLKNSVSKKKTEEKINEKVKHMKKSTSGTYFFFNKEYQNYLMQQKFSKPKNFRSHINTDHIKTPCDFTDKRIYVDLNSDNWRGYYIDEFFKCITLCHTVVPFIQMDAIRNKNMPHITSKHSKGIFHYLDNHNHANKFYNDINKTRNELNFQRYTEYDHGQGIKTSNRLYKDFDKLTINEKKKCETNLYNYTTLTNFKYKNNNKGNDLKFRYFFNKNYRIKKRSFRSSKCSDIYKGIENTETSVWRKYPNLSRNKNTFSCERISEHRDSGYISKKHSVVSFKQISKDKLLSLNSYTVNGSIERAKYKSKYHNVDDKSFELTSFVNEKNLGNSEYEFDKNKNMKFMDNYPSESNIYLDAIKYQSSSLDEECLIYTCNYLGYRLILRNKNIMCVEIGGNFYKWNIIGINEYTNKRGRMSIVVKPEFMHSGSILYVKGSDTSILSLLNLKYSKFLDKIKSNKRIKKNSHDVSSNDNSSINNNKRYKKNYNGRGKKNREKRDRREGENISLKKRFFDLEKHSLKSEHIESIEYENISEKIFCTNYSDEYDEKNEYSNLNDLNEYSNLNDLREREIYAKRQQYKIKKRYRQLEKQLRKFSLKGLRSMIFAFKYLNEEETIKYKRMYDDACLSIYNKEERLMNVAEEIEKDLIYLGITGVKDRLQKKVTKTMEILSQSGIRIWMLTGDNVEYSLHISFLCKILNSHTKIFHAMLENKNYKKLKREGAALYELFQAEKEEKKCYEKLCLLINGKNLQTFLNHSDLQTHFLNMACRSDVVIACRITAKQKAFIVRLIKNRLSPTPNTLAIGDGANDIAMLQEANIGVSIMTSECIISAGYSDYCIKNFCYLRKLLFIYGSKHLYTISIMLYWSFFKNIILILPIFFYQAYAAWSCVKIYPEMLYTFFSIFWVFIPIIYYMFLQHNLNYDILYNIPLFYALSRRKYNMNILKFFSWIIEAIFYAVVIFFFSYIALKENSHLNNGEVVTINTFGNICFLGSLLISIMRLFLEGSLWSPSILITCFGCFLFVFFPSMIFIFFAYLSNEYIREVFRQTFSWNPLYVLLILWFTICIISYIFINFTKTILFPNIYNVVNHWIFEQYQEKHNKYKYAYFLSGKKKFLSLKRFSKKLKFKFRRNINKTSNFKIDDKHNSLENTLISSAKNYKNDQRYIKNNSFSKYFHKSRSSIIDRNIHSSIANLDYNNTDFDEEQKYRGSQVTLSEQAVHGMGNFDSTRKRGKKGITEEYREGQMAKIDKRESTNNNIKNTQNNQVNKVQVNQMKEKELSVHTGKENDTDEENTKQRHSDKTYKNEEKKKREIDEKAKNDTEQSKRKRNEKGGDKSPFVETEKKTTEVDTCNKIYSFQLKKEKANQAICEEEKNQSISNWSNKFNIFNKICSNENEEKDFFKSDDRCLVNKGLLNYRNSLTYDETTISGNGYYIEDSFPMDFRSDEYLESGSRIDESLMAEMKNCLNPLKNTFLVDLLPQGKRFRINEEHIFFKNNERMENIPEPLDVNKRNYYIIQNKAAYYDNESTSEFSYTSADSSNYNGNNKKKNENENAQKEIVKVTNLINRFTLAFKDMQLESGFQIHKKNKFYKTLIPWYRFIFILLGIFFLYIWKLESSLNESWYMSPNTSTGLFVLILYLVFELILLIATVTTFFPIIFIENFNKIINSLVILIITHHVVSYSITHTDGVFQAVLFPLYTFVILRLPFVNAVFCNIIFLSLFIIRFKGDHFLDKKSLAHYIPLFIGVDVFVGFVGYRLEFNQRKNFLLEYSVESSRRKQREILNTMLPAFIVDEMIYSELNEEGIPISLKAEDIDTVTVIFCDIYDFQNIVANIEPTRLVEVLDRLFLCFDKCTEQFNCTKIETVFETYLAACGLVKKEGDNRSGSSSNVNNDNNSSINNCKNNTYDKNNKHFEESNENYNNMCGKTKGQEDAHDSIDFALSILQVSSHIKYEKTKHMAKKNDCYEHDNADEHENINNSMNNMTQGKSLESRPTRIRVKIGIHSGRIIAGVVGSKKPQYALFGDTVNTASRMKTTGKPDYIHLSEATYDLVKDDKTLIYEKKETEIKGKGTMTTYLITSVIGLNYPFVDENVDRKNHFFSDFYADNNKLNNSINYDKTQNILDYYSNKTNQYNEYNLNESTCNIDMNNYGNFDNEINNDYVNLKDLSLNDLPNEYIRDVNMHCYEIIKLRNLKIGAALGYQLKQKDFLNMSFLNNELHNDSTTNFNHYLENNKDFDDIKDFNTTYMNKLSLSDSLYYLNDNLINKDQNSEIIQKKTNPEIMKQVNAQSMNNLTYVGIETHDEDDDEDYKNVQLCAKKCRTCSERYCTVSNCINYDHVSHVAYHKMLNNKRRNYLRSIMKKGKRDGETETGGESKHQLKMQKEKKKQQEQQQKQLEADETSKKGALNMSGLTSCLLKIFTFSRKRKKEKHNTICKKQDQERGKGIASISSEWIFLKFSDKNLESKYRSHFYSNKSNLNSIEQALIIFLVAFVMQTLISSTVPIVFVDHKRATQTLQVNYFIYWSVRSVYTYLGFMLWLLFHYRTRPEVSSLLNIKWMIFFLNLLFISAACVFSVAYLWSISETDQTTSHTIWMTNDTIEFFFYLVILHHNTGMLFQTCILVDLLLITMSLTFISTSVVKTITTDSTLLLIPWYVAFNLISTYCKESIDRRTFYANESAKKTENRATELLNDMLPKHVLEEFQQDKLKLAYTHDRLTFLFADICGFTSWANGVDASEVLTLLQKLFAKFDNDSTKYGLYKLCTIGDAYVAISEPVTEDNQDYDPVDGTERVLEMAYSMIRIIKEIREKLGIPNLNMRIGLHYGSCVGGVIGSGRLRYDLWGIDVLTGNLMESNGIPGKINVSETLKNFLLQQFKNRFIFKANTTVRVIYKDVKCFIINDKKEIDSSNNSKTLPSRSHLFNRKFQRQNHLGTNRLDNRRTSTLSISTRNLSNFNGKKFSSKDLYYINVNNS
ncbi:guanylyl cyclase, putative [Plasmodium malariae]|uniref:guanylate cyclase n=1 Tax=Plasmodium malariae TaxID=5858 RepID=A0A1C3KD01_PLAMA|nr:guanylyl cyclase, putative [Plasmodium malariae]